MRISIVIPTYNEEEHIAKLLKFIYGLNNKIIKEVIVCDGGSSDNTLKLANQYHATILNSKKGRGSQMNTGASMASGEILYFLHADSIPPVTFPDDILNAVRKGFECGCYKLAFDYNHWFLKLNCWFTRFNINAVRFGDQSLFITKNNFIASGGFNEKLVIMEDQEIIYRIKKRARFKVLSGFVITSARKYIDNGIFKTQGLFFIIFCMYQTGFSQERLINFFNSHIKKSKLV